MKDSNGLILLAASLIAATYFFIQNTELKNQLNNLQTEYNGFKEGVIYAK